MKRQVNPVVAAIVLIVVLGAVLGVYTRGLLGGKKPGGPAQMGGGMGTLPPPPAGLPTVTVTTFAGWVRPGLADGRGTEARFNGPAALAAAADGTLYVCDSRNNRLRRVTPDGTTTTVAGSGVPDCLTAGLADGPARQARLSSPSGVCLGRDGAVYIADTGNHRIRVLRGDRVSTLAGGPSSRDAVGLEEGGFRDGPGPEARFRWPSAMAMTPSGGILVADVGNSAIRRVAPDGRVSTVARGGALRAPTGLAVLPGGGVWVADSEAALLLDVSGSVAKAAGPGAGGMPPRRPCAAVSMPGGALVVADAEWHSLFGIKEGHTPVLLAGYLPPQPRPGYTDETGDLARFCRPCALATAGGTVYVADFGNNCIRAVTGAGLDPKAWRAAPEESRRPAPWERRDGGRRQPRRDGNEFGRRDDGRATQGGDRAGR